MFKNLIKIAFRNLRKEKVYSAINVLGLTIGITCSLFLYLYIQDELSYDRYHADADNIYRIVSNIKEPDNAFTWAVVQMPLAEELRDNYPEVKNVTRFNGIGRSLYKLGNRQFYESDFYYADSTVFDMFSYEFLSGDAGTALDLPNSIVITEKIARKYFDNPLTALNQTLRGEGDNTDYKVTGVIKDVPLNSHLRFDALISMNTLPDRNPNWGGIRNHHLCPIAIRV